jgi:hypothetical protein
MAMAFTVWALVFADRIVRQERRWSGPMFGVMVGLAVATQISTVFVFVGIVLAMMVIAPNRQTVRSLVIAGFVAAGVFAPFVWAVISNPGQVDWISNLTIDLFVRQLLSAAGGGLGALMIASGWVCLIAASVRRVQFRQYLMALAGSVSGVVGLVLVSLAGKPMFVDRYLIGCIPLAVIAAAGGWSAVWPRRWSIVAVAIVGVSVVNLGIFVDRTKPLPEGYREAAVVLLDQVQSGDAIVVMVGVWTPLGLDHYLPEGTSRQKLVASWNNPDSWVIRDQDGNEFRTNRIWILDNGPPSAFSAVKAGDWIQRRFPIVTTDMRFGSIRLQLRETSGG